MWNRYFNRRYESYLKLAGVIFILSINIYTSCIHVIYTHYTYNIIYMYIYTYHICIYTHIYIIYIHDIYNIYIYIYNVYI